MLTRLHNSRLFETKTLTLTAFVIITLAFLICFVPTRAQEPFPNCVCAGHSSGCTTCAASGDQWFCTGSNPPQAGYKVGNCYNYVPGQNCSYYQNISCGSMIDCYTLENITACASTDEYCK